MTINYVLVYKENYSDNRLELRIYDNELQAIKEAQKMLDQFKYWGGGCVPVSVSVSKWRSNGKYAGGEMLQEFNPMLYLPYARENGTLYGYYKIMNKNNNTMIA